MDHRLSIVLGPHGQVRDLRSGAVTVPGHALDFVEVKRMPDAYRDMARTQPYAISEMAPTAYLQALSAGAPITALPLPMTRRFRHAGVLKRRGSPLAGPADLAGRSVGVRAYAVTAAVWTRGIYADDYGLDTRQVAWLTEEEENLSQFPLPPNARRIAPGQTLARLFQDGSIDAAFAGLAGAGDAGGDDVEDLVPDAAEREAQWFRRTGIYPLHGVIVLRNDVIAAHPRLPLQLFRAFEQAKSNYLERIRAGGELDAEDKRYLKLQALVGDPLPYGLAENAASFDALLRYVHRQGLVPSCPRAEAVFVDPRTTAMPATATWTA